MSKMKEVANILNVEIGEEFRATGINEDFRITDSRFERLTICNEWVEAPSDILYGLLTGKLEVIKIPWKPKAREKFFTCVRGYYVNQEWWTNCASDLMAYAVGNCFRTQEEAEAHCKKVLDRLQRIYDEGKPLI